MDMLHYVLLAYSTSLITLAAFGGYQWIQYKRASKRK